MKVVQRVAIVLFFLVNACVMMSLSGGGVSFPCERQPSKQASRTLNGRGLGQLPSGW